MRTALASNLNTTSTQLNNLNSDVNTRITADVQQINSISTQISALNQQIAASTGSGQAPNTLLDQRDQLVSNLSQIVGVTTTSNSDGSINVYVGNGQPLVLDSNTYSLTTVPNQFNASQLEIASSTSNGNSISSSITSGDLGGLLSARTQAIDPALNQLGQIATAVAQSANTQQASGLDLNGQLGSELFSVGAPVATASSANTDGTTASVTHLQCRCADLGQLSAVVHRRRLYPYRPNHRRQCGAHGRRHRGKPVDGRRIIHRAVGDPGLGRPVSHSADGAGGRNAERRLDQPLRPRRRRRRPDLGIRQQHRHGHHRRRHGHRPRQSRIC